MDLIVEFHIGFLVRWDMESVTITDGKAVAKRYILRGTFFIDLLAFSPFILQIVFLGSSSTSSNRSAAQILMLLRLLRLLRVVNLIMVSVFVYHCQGGTCVHVSHVYVCMYAFVSMWQQCVI